MSWRAVSNICSGKCPAIGDAMRYKKLFLVFFVLILFIAQQASVGAKIIPNYPVTHPLADDFGLSLSLLPTVRVVFYRLNPDGSLFL